MLICLWLIVLITATVILLYHRCSSAVYVIGISILLLILSVLIPVNLFWIGSIWLGWSIFIVFFKTPLRRILFSRHLIKMFNQHAPTFSATEQAVIGAGNIGWEADIFKGEVDFDKLTNLPTPELNEFEEAFLDGPVRELCLSIKSYEINSSGKIPEEIWQKLKMDGFFGLVIPKEYGGKGFSSFAQSEIISRIAMVNSAVATIVSVPNSLGPAELLLHYGLNEQKQKYLPLLATGAEIPCFALTSPVAGSDASAIVDYGIVCERDHNGVKEMGVSLNWNKRYITLAPVATLLGLAFQLYDPDKLLGQQEYLGITCALAPTNLPGITIGRYHNPLHAAFPNGPTQGSEVFITLDQIIGGVGQVGKGWQMLMERLAVGRSISLPSISAGSMKAVTAASSAYARIRRQFNTYIGDFGGIQRHLAKMLSNCFIADSLRLFSVGQIDQGIHSATAAAICKYHTTERGRQVIQAGMDIHGGKGICMGPNNFLAQAYIETPIAITVEGANILTRSLIIFGQGALRCHPYLLNEIQSAREKNVVLFDQYFFDHIGYFLSHQVRAIVMRLFNGKSDTLDHLSVVFSAAVDILLVSQGRTLKRREQLSARLSDLLSDLYMLSAVIKQAQSFEKNDDLANLLSWSCQELVANYCHQYHEMTANLSGFLKIWLSFLLGPLKNSHLPNDQLTELVARSSLEPGAVRQWLSQGMADNNSLIKLEDILQKMIFVEPLLNKIKLARQKGEINGKNSKEWAEDALNKQILTESEYQELTESEQLRMSIIQVDDYSEQEKFHGPHLV